MKSKYGNIVVDSMKLIFSLFSLGLIIISTVNDEYIFFGISSIVYVLPKFLSCIVEIEKNLYDKPKLCCDLFVFASLFVSLLMVCLVIVAEYTKINTLKNCIGCFILTFDIFAIFSLASDIFQIYIGIKHKFNFI